MSFYPVFKEQISYLSLLPRIFATSNRRSTERKIHFFRALAKKISWSRARGKRPPVTEYAVKHMFWRRA